MIVRGTPAPQRYTPPLYWEDRARRFAGERDGLAAVCAYGMPEFYNRAIDWEQRLALAPWLRVSEGTRVLDVGCGIGRWSRLLAARGAQVRGRRLEPHDDRPGPSSGGRGGRCRPLPLCRDGPCPPRSGRTIRHGAGSHCPTAYSGPAVHFAPHWPPWPGISRRAAGWSCSRRRPPRRSAAAIPRCSRRVIATPTSTRSALAASTVRALTGVDPAPFRRQLLPYLRDVPRAAGAELAGAGYRPFLADRFAFCPSRGQALLACGIRTGTRQAGTVIMTQGRSILAVALLLAARSDGGAPAVGMTCSAPSGRRRRLKRA